MCEWILACCYAVARWLLEFLDCCLPDQDKREYAQVSMNYSNILVFNICMFLGVIYLFTCLFILDLKESKQKKEQKKVWKTKKLSSNRKKALKSERKRKRKHKERAKDRRRERVKEKEKESAK